MVRAARRSESARRDARSKLAEHRLSVLELARELGSVPAACWGDRIAAVPGQQVIAVALECGLSAYDAEFVVLARSLGVPLVTLDQAILAGAPDIAVPLPVA